MADDFDTDLDNVIEIDFTNVPDRYAQHLTNDSDEVLTEEEWRRQNPSSSDEIEVPPYWESEKEIHELYSRDSLDKAFKLVKAGRVKNAGRPEIYQVEGSELYVCTVIELEDSVTPGVTCTCPNGSNRSGRPTCYHTAAVLLVHQGLDPDTYALKMAGFPT